MVASIVITSHESINTSIFTQVASLEITFSDKSQSGNYTLELTYNGLKYFSTITLKLSGKLLNKFKVINRSGFIIISELFFIFKDNSH